MNDEEKAAAKEALKEAYKKQMDINDDIDDIMETAFSNPVEAKDFLDDIYRDPGMVKRIEVNGGALGKVKGTMLGNAMTKPFGSKEHDKAKQALSQLAGKVEARIKIEDKIEGLKTKIYGSGGGGKDHEPEPEYDPWDRT